MPDIVARQRSQLLAQPDVAPETRIKVADTNNSAAVESRPTQEPPRPAPQSQKTPRQSAVRTAALPPVAPTPAQIPVAAERGGIYLQLGAFSARDNAENFRTRVYQQLSWLDKAVEIIQREGVFRLHLGPYRDRAEANTAAEQIRENIAFKPVLILR